MQASLSFIPDPSSLDTFEELPNIHQSFIMKARQITSQASHEHEESIILNTVNQKIKSIAATCERQLKDLLKIYEKEKQLPIDCTLTGKELIDEYFKKLKDFIDSELKLETETIEPTKCSKKKLTILKQSCRTCRECKKTAQLATFRKDKQTIVLLQDFALENSENKKILIKL